MSSGPWWVQALYTLVPTLFASTGFWAFVQRRDRKKSATDILLLGLAYDKIVSLGRVYISRGWLTEEEYRDFQKYFYTPYKNCGGNGVADKIMDEVKNLPLRSIEHNPPSIRRDSKR